MSAESDWVWPYSRVLTGQVLEAHSALQHSYLQIAIHSANFWGRNCNRGWLWQCMYSTGGCCLAGSAACPDTLKCCCFRSIMSRPGAESCPWQNKFASVSLCIVYTKHIHNISKYFSQNKYSIYTTYYAWHIKILQLVYQNIIVSICIVYTQHILTIS